MDYKDDSWIVLKTRSRCVIELCRLPTLSETYYVTATNICNISHSLGFPGEANITTLLCYD